MPLIEYLLTEEQLERLKSASRMDYRENRDGSLMATTREQERTRLRVNDAWHGIGLEVGFDWTTVKPHPGGDEYRFLAAPLVNAATET